TAVGGSTSPDHARADRLRHRALVRQESLVARVQPPRLFRLSVLPVPAGTAGRPWEGHVRRSPARPDGNACTTCSFVPLPWAWSPSVGLGIRDIGNYRQASWANC